MVLFDPKAHRYTDLSGNVLISVTTLIKKYVPPFDAHYWSTYKAMKEVLTKKGEWNDYKRIAGGWENVVAYVRDIDKTFPHKNEVIDAKKQLLQQWKETGESAAELGTFFHKMKEKATREGEVVDPHSLMKVPVVADTTLQDPPDFTSSGLFLESLIYNEKVGIAGTADFVMKSGKVISIKDYKTSKDISKRSFMDDRLLWPVNHLPNARYYIYSLQLSLYGWLLEQSGYEIRELHIEHVDRGTHQTIEIAQCEYYKKEIEDIIEDYTKSVSGKTIPLASHEVIP